MFKWLLTEKSSKWLIGAGFLILLIGLLIFIWQDHIFDWNNTIKSDKVGQLGDFVGGIVGSLWALAGVILFYVALNEQRKDIQINKDALEAQVKALNQQIEEFKLQKIELEQTREVFKIQSETMQLQQFESTFFNLLGIHQNNIKDMDISFEKLKNGFSSLFSISDSDFKTINLQGRDCFTFFVSKLKESYGNKKEQWHYEDQYIDEYDFLSNLYSEFYSSHQSNLGHYFRTLYHIYKFVKLSNMPDKNRYTSLIRAQLSNDELVMIFYNGLSQNGEKFKPIIEEFHVFKNLNLGSLLNLDEHKLLYAESAYIKASKEDEKIA